MDGQERARLRHEVVVQLEQDPNDPFVRDMEWLLDAADECEVALARVERLREALTVLIGPSVIYDGWTPCSLESGNCFWCGANQHIDEPHAPGCALVRARAALAADDAATGTSGEPSRESDAAR